MSAIVPNQTLYPAPFLPLPHNVPPPTPCPPRSVSPRLRDRWCNRNRHLQSRPNTFHARPPHSLLRLPTPATADASLFWSFKETISKRLVMLDG
jgi:hypothetical protein